LVFDFVLYIAVRDCPPHQKLRTGKYCWLNRQEGVDCLFMCVPQGSLSPRSADHKQDWRSRRCAQCAECE